MPRLATTLAVALSFGAVWSTAVQASEDGDKNLGRAFAEAKCADCHAIEPGAKSSPELKAPPFSQMMTSEKLTTEQIEGWLVSSHKNMPAVTVPQEARANLVAYIKSLALAK